MDNETFLACQLAIRERIKAIDLFYSRNSPQSNRAGLVQMGFALRLLARRYIKAADWPGHEVTDDVRLNWELEWYMNYIEATAQVCKAAQIAVREKRLTLRSQLTQTPLDVAALDAWLNMDIDATLAAGMKGFFPGVMKVRPAFDSWPDGLCMPSGGAYIQDIAVWAAGDGLAAVDDVVLLLTGIAPAQTATTPAPVGADSVSGTPAPERVADWRNAVRAEAWEQWVKTLAENGTPTLENVSVHVANWCVENNIKTNLGRPPMASYLKTNIIDSKHWEPPRNMSRDKAKKHLEQKKQEKEAK